MESRDAAAIASERSSATARLALARSTYAREKKLFDARITAKQDLEAAAAQYRNALGAKVGAPQPEPDHGVTVIFIELPNTKIELLYPLGENSPIAGFLEKNPAGGIHHICYEVEDILAARDRLKASGARVLGSGEPKIGAHGKPVLFLHPKDFNGCLVELEQV